MVLKFVLRVASTLYGLFNFTIYAAIALKDGAFFSKPSDKVRKELAAAQHKFWSLNESPFGLKHGFFTLNNGTKLHYVTTGPPKNTSTRTNLVIFIHGFPDSWVVWQHVLRSSRLRLADDSVFVAVDLPGYGGSDNLPVYNAENVMETMTGFVLGMREKYLLDGEISPKERGRVVIVTHDWGSVVGYRLAAEAPSLADRFIITCVMHPNAMISGVKGRLASSSQMLRTWAHKPTSTRLLGKAWSTLSPVLSQLNRSGYIFAFRLPKPIADRCGTMGNNWLLRVMHRAAARSKTFLEGAAGAESMAGSLGPSLVECTGDGYPEGAKSRAKHGVFLEMVRYYRDELALGRWEKSLETLAELSTLESQGHRRRNSSGVGIFEDGPKGALKARATLLFGLKDLAFEPTMILEGLSDYIPRGSQIVTLPRTGHWLPCEEEGIDVLLESITWSLEGEKGSLKKRLEDTRSNAKVTVER
ncbi:alpha/beta fold family hydrolase [Patellaria atrata CBS 101060]|uniref:Alpha/beta fold family hydrolase n=1 Tax=Patellaria atrata CBS 101060 TaxID=1346257 RepID=A0A9P4VLN7_9PEZI|nr:alpha/beta fold family hydrolase [Patellaria atrata CBS 101060]